MQVMNNDHALRPVQNAKIPGGKVHTPVSQTA